MAIVNGYCSLIEIKARLDVTNTSLDTILENVVEAASRAIDGFCNRRFYRVTETRTYTAEWSDWLVVDDLGSVTTLKTDKDGDRVYEDTWATTDYDLEPFNASLDGAPFTRIRVAPNGTKSFPTTRKGVEIAGSFGYSATTPDAINEACLIQSARIYKRKDAPFGVAGNAELGQLQVLQRLDPDVRELIAPFRRMHVGAV